VKFFGGQKKTYAEIFIIIKLIFFKYSIVENIGFQNGYQVLNVFPKMFPIAALHFKIPDGDVDPCRAGQIEISSLWHPYTGEGGREGRRNWFLLSAQPGTARHPGRR
jgi:hypothetical protein